MKQKQITSKSNVLFNLCLSVIIAIGAIATTDDAEARRSRGYGTRTYSSKRLGSGLSSRSYTYTRGYTKKSGRYIGPHYRTKKNAIRQDNWSYKGNVNPFTGKIGSK